MSTPILVTCGTAGGRWARLGSMSAGGSASAPPAFRQWLDGLPAAATGPAADTAAHGPAAGAAIAALATPIAGDAIHAVHPRTWRVLPALAQALPHAGFLLLVEPPAAGLAVELEAGTNADPAAWLAAWAASARALLAHVQRHPGRCLVVDTGEAVAEPRRMLEALRQRLGPAGAVLTEEAAVAAGSTGADTDPVSAALAEALCLADPQLLSLHAELLACAQPLERAAPARPLLAARPSFEPKAVARALAALLAARGQVATLQGQLDAATARLTQAVAERDSGRRELEAERQKAQTRQQQQATAEQQQRQEADTLLMQLHQVQEELEQYYLRNRSLEHAATRAGSLDLMDLAIDRIELVAERDTPPHREIAFRLQGLRVDARSFDECVVRLVEHHGHPGIVYFGVASGAHPLESWGENGREGDAPYMLLVPDDANCRSLFDAMSSTDFALTRAIAGRIERELRGSEQASLAPLWRGLARRLLQALQEMPPRFRYGTLRVAPAGQADDLAIAYRFDRVDCGPRRLPELHVIWRPVGPGSSLTLMADGPDGPPLTAWPDDGQGRFPDRLVVPLGAQAPGDAARATWQGFADADRRFVLALVQAWPLVVAATPDPVLAALPNGVNLRVIAEGLLQEARRALAPTLSAPARPRGVLRRAARWLGGSPRSAT